MAAPTPQTVLTQRLVALLGFEDGASDVLDHLLSIESSQDLTDYLSQLLGRNDEEVQKFVSDVGRFQRGEPLSAGDDELSVEDAKPAAKPSPTHQEATKKPKAKPSELTKQPSIHTVFGHVVSNQKAVAAKPTAAAKKAPAAASHPSQQAPKDVNAYMAPPVPIAPRVQQQKKAPAAVKSPPKSRPPKGKASVVCGCYGTMHKPLTNCLYCGRISCEKEGYDYCPFCGMLVEQVTGGGPDQASKAWEHKERLLRFDRDFARRTIVLDDQADFFTSNKSWLTEEERAAAEAKQSEHQEKLRSREKQTLDIAF